MSFLLTNKAILVTKTGSHSHVVSRGTQTGVPSLARHSSERENDLLEILSTGIGCRVARNTSSQKIQNRKKSPDER